jgi:sirohydrochlorin cobaltochelatase
MQDRDEQCAQKWGVLLVGHGTRNDAGRAEFQSTAAEVAAKMPHVAVEPCFLELAEPDIETGVKRLADRQVEGICSVPLMLFAAGHVKRDVPTAVEEAVQKHTTVPCVQAEHLGCHETLLELSAQRYHDAVADRHGVTPDETVLFMVSHGSRDPIAVREARRFAELRQAMTPLQLTEMCFVSMAEPALDRRLKALNFDGVRRGVVQPHVLFSGKMLSYVQDQVAAVAASQPQIDWIVPGHLGSSELLSRTIVDLAERTIFANPPKNLRTGHI